MDKDVLYWLALIIALIMVVLLMWRDRHAYICSECGKKHKLINGSSSQDSWCDECRCVTRMVKE